MTSTTLINDALSDLSFVSPGQTSKTDILNICLRALNQMMDDWAFERIFFYKTDKTVLASFADLTTDYPLAAGYSKVLQKNLAITAAPLLKRYFKTEPLLEPLQAEAARLKQSVRGVGVA